jgi:outer membrane receptor protein involved in Fe transport
VTLSLAQTLDMGRFGSITPRWDGAWKSTTFFDATAGLGIPNAQDIQFLPENTIGQEGFWLHNLRVTYKTEMEDIEVAFWVRNVADKRYKTFGFDGSTFNNTTIYFVGTPRILGGSLKVNF